MPTALIAVGVLWQDNVAYLYHAQASAQGFDAHAVPGILPVAESSIGQVLRSDDQQPVALIHQRFGPVRSSEDTSNQSDAEIQVADQVALQQHRSVAVPIREHGQAIAGLAASHLSLDIEPTAIVHISASMLWLNV